MILKKQTIKILLFAVVLLCLNSSLHAADRYSVTSGNWNVSATWSATSGGPSGATPPVAGDVVYIESNHSISVTANAGCASIVLTGNGAILTVNLAVTLSVSSSVTLNNQSTSSSGCTVTGAGTLSCTNVEVGSATNTPSGNRDIFTHTMGSTVANMIVSGTLNINSYYAGFRTAGNGVFNLESGTLSLGGKINGNNQNNQNESTFSMAAGSGSGTLNLSGTTPINLHRIRDVLNLNGSASTVNFTRSGAQTIMNTAFNNITFSGSGSKTFPNQGSTTIYGVLSLEGTATAGGKAPSFGNDATLQYRGSAQQTTGIEFPATFSGSGGVIIDNLNGVILGGNKTIDLELTFINGVITTGINTLTLDSGCTVTGAGAGNYVLGNLEKGIGTATGTKTFEIGDASGYTPVVLSFSGTTNGTGTIVAYTSTGDHPQIGASIFSSAYTVNRYWTMTNNGVTGYTAFDATFTFLPGDADPGTDPNGFVVGNYNPATWTYPSTGIRSSTSTQATGVTTFGDFQIGQFAAAYRSVTSGNWDQTASWEAFIGGAWSPAPAAPYSASNTITVLSPHTITTTTPFSVDELTIDAGATLVLGADMTVTDGVGTDVILNGTLDCGGTYTLSGPGSFALNSAATILLGSPEGITSTGASGNIQTSFRSFDVSANYIYNGSVAQVTGDGLPSIVNNLSIDNTSGVTLTASATINGILALSNGVLSTGATTLIFQNSDTPIVRGSGTISTNPSTDLFFGTAGNTGGAAFVIPAGTFTAPPVINNLTINRVNNLTLSDQNLSITGILLCNGPLNTAGNLTLLSDASATALIDGSGTGSVSGDVTMQRYLPVGFGYKYFSSPFQGATVNEFGDDMDLTYWFPTFYRYDENRTSSGWVSYNDPAGVMAPMSGYSVNFGSVSAPNTVDLTGVVSNGTLSLTLYNNNNPYTLGLNLVGNPYPSAIDWDAVSGWTKTNIDNAVYYFKASATDQYGGTYSSYVNGISSDGIVSNVIPSMQGFFVHVSDGAYPVTGTLGMNNSVRIADRTQSFAKSAPSTRAASVPLIRLSAVFPDDPSSADPFVIYLDDLASTGFDRDMDAYKLLNSDFSVPNLYAILPGDYKLSIDAIPVDFEMPNVIPLGVKTNRQGILSFTLNHIDAYFSRFDLYLSDAETGVRHRLLDESEYTVFMEPGEYNNRFSLEIVDFSLDIPMPLKTEEIFTVFLSDGLLKARIFEESGERGMLSLHSITGQAIFMQKISGPGNYEFKSPDNPGIYIVSYVSGVQTASVKIFIGN